MKEIVLRLPNHVISHLDEMRGEKSRERWVREQIELVLGEKGNISLESHVPRPHSVRRHHPRCSCMICKPPKR
jgi:hypothetical protein